MSNRSKKLVFNHSFAFALTFLAACTHSKVTEVTPVIPSLPAGPAITAHEVPKGTSQLIAGPFHSHLNVTNFGTKKDSLFLEVEGVLSPESYAQLKATGGKAAIQKTLSDTFSKLKNVGAIEVSQSGEVGYFTFFIPYERDMLGALKTVSLPAEIYINPLHYDVDSLKAIKGMTAQSEGFAPRGTTSGFSGLNQIHAPEFVALAQQKVPNAKIDGSSVRVGITDTGITYRHPTFMDASGTKNRIAYMKDFTKEGRVYFNPSAKFEAKLTNDQTNEFTIQAEYIEAKMLPGIPQPNEFKSVADLKITVSDELKAILADPKKKVSFGYLSENVFQSDEDPVDINANGALDDQIPLLMVVDTETNESKVYADFNVKNNFSKSQGLHDFNLNHETTKVFAESIGFHIQKDKLMDGETQLPVAMMSASIMGYDAGNHGSHVAGIAAGRKTIANDSDDTLARGVAPNAQIFMDRVCANNGGCGATSAIIDLAINGHVDVINMSLGGLSPFNDGYGVQETVVNRLSSVFNVLFSISAGNSGPGRQTIGSPSVARLSLSIGAAASRSMIARQYQWPGTGAISASTPEEDEFMLFFSSRGPTAAGGFKPNVAAPGTELSSVQLNAAPGNRSGLDVYWGTSMAAPTATGAYALLLDAIRKFNDANPSEPVTTNAMTIRQVIIQTARPFSRDQFTWMDEGTGMIDLVAAWKALIAMRSETLTSGVSDASGKNVALDYEVITSLKNPTGGAYNGSRVVTDASNNKIPAFGSGLYLSTADTGSFYSVQIARRLPENLSVSEEAGDLTVQLVTTAEEFKLVTDFGADSSWLKAGVLDEIDCANSDTANLRILGRGAEIKRHEDGTGEINGFGASNLNVCVDRGAIAKMSPGDHGALIYAYRTDGKSVASIPSFIVPVSITIPHQALANSTAYEVNGKVKSFQVARNYVVIPEGSKMVRVTVEVPAIKAGESCSGVELMDLEGGNTLKGSETRAQMRISNCEANASPVSDDKKRTLVLNRTNPTAGVWDLHIFGSYRFNESAYRIRVDYLMAETSVTEIKGDVSALTGTMNWNMKEASLMAILDSVKSSYVMNGLLHREASKVAKDEQVFVDGPLGKFRQYPAGVKSVTITTGGSPGNDIDLDVLECDDAQGSACVIAGQSGSATDVEKVTFKPEQGKFYVARVLGYAIKDDGTFYSDETMNFAEEVGTLAMIPAESGSFTVQYSFSPEQLKASKILTNELFTTKKYQATGAITLRTADKVTLGAVEVTVDP